MFYSQNQINRISFNNQLLMEKEGRRIFQKKDDGDKSSESASAKITTSELI